MTSNSRRLNCLRGLGFNARANAPATSAKNQWGAIARVVFGASAPQPKPNASGPIFCTPPYLSSSACHSSVGLQVTPNDRFGFSSYRTVMNSTEPFHDLRCEYPLG